MLQARPVTSVDNIDSEFETFHEVDSGLVAEYDAVSKANIGCVWRKFLPKFCKDKCIYCAVDSFTAERHFVPWRSFVLKPLSVFQ